MGALEGQDGACLQCRRAIPEAKGLPRSSNSDTIGVTLSDKAMNYVRKEESPSLEMSKHWLITFQGNSPLNVKVLRLLFQLLCLCLSPPPPPVHVKCNLLSGLKLIYYGILL